MSAPVDVLAVMDSAARACVWERDEANSNGDEIRGETWERHRAELRAARAAVAELIDATKAMPHVPAPPQWKQTERGDIATFWMERGAWKRFRAALAKVGAP